MMKYIFASCLAIVTTTCVFAQDDQFEINGDIYKIPSASNVQSILDTTGSLSMEVSCSNLSATNVASEILNNSEAALNSIKDNLFTIESGVTLLVYSQPRLYQAMQHFRQAADFSLAIASTSCNDLQRHLMKDDGDPLDEARKLKAKCLDESPGDSNCLSGMSTADAIGLWIEEAAQTMEDVNTNHALSLSKVGNDVIYDERRYLPESVVDSLIQEASPNTIIGCHTGMDKISFLKFAFNGSCENIQEFSLVYPSMIFPSEQSFSTKSGISSFDNLHKYLYNYYSDLFLELSNGSGTTPLFNDHNNVYYAPMIRDTDIQKITLANTPSTRKAVIKLLAVKYSYRNIDVYGDAMERIIFEAVSSNFASKRIPDKDFLSSYRRQIIAKSKSRLNHLRSIVDRKVSFSG